MVYKNLFTVENLWKSRFINGRKVWKEGAKLFVFRGPFFSLPFPQVFL